MYRAFVIIFLTIILVLEYKKGLEFEIMNNKYILLEAKNKELNTSLNHYKVTKDYLEDLGASEEIAIEIIKASEVHNIDPKYMGH